MKRSHRTMSLPVHLFLSLSLLFFSQVCCDQGSLIHNCLTLPPPLSGDLCVDITHDGCNSITASVSALGSSYSQAANLSTLFDERTLYCYEMGGHCQACLTVRAQSRTSNSVSACASVAVKCYGVEVKGVRVGCFSIDDCDKLGCVNGCSGHGNCSDGVCRCSPGYHGLDCSIGVTDNCFSFPAFGQYCVKPKLEQCNLEIDLERENRVIMKKTFDFGTFSSGNAVVNSCNDLQYCTLCYNITGRAEHGKLKACAWGNLTCLSSYVGDYNFGCHDSDDFCYGSNCAQNCSGTGYCIDSQCVCTDGFGVGCQLRLDDGCVVDKTSGSKACFSLEDSSCEAAVGKFTQADKLLVEWSVPLAELFLSSSSPSGQWRERKVVDALCPPVHWPDRVQQASSVSWFFSDFRYGEREYGLCVWLACPGEDKYKVGCFQQQLPNCGCERGEVRQVEGTTNITVTSRWSAAVPLHRPSEVQLLLSAGEGGGRRGEEGGWVWVKALPGCLPSSDVYSVKQKLRWPPTHEVSVAALSTCHYSHLRSFDTLYFSLSCLPLTAEEQDNTCDFGNCTSSCSVTVVPLVSEVFELEENGARQVEGPSVFYFNVTEESFLFVLTVQLTAAEFALSEVRNGSWFVVSLQPPALCDQPTATLTSPTLFYAGDEEGEVVFAEYVMRRTQAEAGRWAGRVRPGKAFTFTTPPSVLFSANKCPGECSGHGNCEADGTCRCGLLFSGPDCRPKDSCGGCNSRGFCKKGRCECVKPWNGADCATANCPRNCSGAGTCLPSSGVCLCHDGYTSEDCSQRDKAQVPELLKVVLFIGAGLAVFGFVGLGAGFFLKWIKKRKALQNEDFNHLPSESVDSAIETEAMHNNEEDLL